ncbi:MAG: rod shape-determining protein [Lachnospiraceae bacterium]|nr:rod shape-determining protein [Lachnospiraceae bacterium]
MGNEMKTQGQLVFGLDIGTRSIVGTVGYREGDRFIVAAQVIKEHETRAMLDGQIHDIGQVGNTITQVKRTLEKKLSVKLTDVCIAAAGRVLLTFETSVTWEFEKERVVTPEEIMGLTSLGIEKAYEKLQETNDSDMKFYCVGNSVIRYYLNGYPISNLENHKAKNIGADIIATFLPDDVVDGLYRAVELAGLNVVNMTLEPIAAMTVAIPQMYRMLNIALVDVGAGTSDICITKDGCIVAYGMIPCAGDSLTEVVAKECLVDFETAEKIKRGGGKPGTEVKYKDIMGLQQSITRQRVLKMLSGQIDQMAKLVSDKIKELNGGKAVSAVFIVGGGGKITGYPEKLAEHLGIQKERVALRGEEVMQNITFQEKIKKDSLLVTPIGICLNYYDQNNNFIYVTFNEEHIKLYDNSNLAIVDAAMQADFPNDKLFPKRGSEIAYTLNGKKKICRGEFGEAAKILLNGEEADLYSAIHANDVIMVEESTAGNPAAISLGQLPEFKSKIGILVNGNKVTLPKYASVNGKLENEYYDIRNGDKIEMLGYYTVAQIREFMDVTLDMNMAVYVNNELAEDDTRVYENFSIRMAIEEESRRDVLEDEEVEDGEVEEEAASQDNIVPDLPTVSIGVLVNSRPIVLQGKTSYVFVDIFDYIDFDLNTVQGKTLITTVNGKKAEYMEPLYDGAVIEVYWEE